MERRVAAGARQARARRRCARPGRQHRHCRNRARAGPRAVTAEILARAGGPVGAGGLALLFVAAPRWTRLLGFVAGLVGIGLLVPLLLPSGGRLFLAGGGVAAAALTVALGALFQRHPWALPPLALVAVPARIPITVGGRTNNLLVPLYVLIA